MAVRLLDVPVVVYRTASGVAALLDRCPHRNVPLSLGQVQAVGTMRCAYHGWEFRTDGSCAGIPGHLGRIPPKLGIVPAFATREQGGLIWIYATPDVEPEPPMPPMTDRPYERGYVHALREVAVDASLHATIENALDVPHTAFLHAGLFRGTRRNRITATTTRDVDRVVTEYNGEPRPSGLAARLLSPSGGEVQHWDRFILPSIAEVEYRIGTESHFLVTAYCTPVAENLTKIFALVSFRTRIPGWLLLPLLQRFALRIFAQDATILGKQADNIRQFGGERFTHTELDLMGPQVWRLLHQDADAGGADAMPTTKTVEFEA